MSRKQYDYLMAKIAEVYGHGIENHSPTAIANRTNRLCPFRGSSCTKTSKINPVGICSLGDGSQATVTCPVRFIQDGRIFKDAARIAFGAGATFKAVSEVKILKVGKKKIGKVDYLITKVDKDGQALDFAALEVQAVYFSGKGIRPALKYFLENGRLNPEDSDRRPDYRSCAQKRLMPQLRLKVPVFRRWGKKFFVVVDKQFFSALPPFKRKTAANSEITWLVYGFNKQADGDYSLSQNEPEVIFSDSEDVMNALREGEAPEPEEILLELNARSKKVVARTA